MGLGFDPSKLAAKVRDIPDFPKAGVVFKDVTPMLADPVTFSTAVDAIVLHFGRGTIDKVVGIEARGFIFAAPVAYHFGAGFIPARKGGKLPAARRSVEFELEYGRDTIEMHEDAFTPGDRVLIVDDVLATGGTAAATVELVEALGGRVIGLAFLIELGFLGGGARIADHERLSLIEY